MDEKITNFDSFLEKIKVVLDKYIDVFDTKLWNSMNVEPVQLNVREGACADQHQPATERQERSWCRTYWTSAS